MFIGHVYRSAMPDRPWSERQNRPGLDGKDGQALSLVDFPGPSKSRGLAVPLQALEMCPARLRGSTWFGRHIHPPWGVMELGCVTDMDALEAATG